jgi:hypothetical protein
VGIPLASELGVCTGPLTLATESETGGRVAWSLSAAVQDWDTGVLEPDLGVDVTEATLQDTGTDGGLGADTG